MFYDHMTLTYSFVETLSIVLSLSMYIYLLENVYTEFSIMRASTQIFHIKRVNIIYYKNDSQKVLVYKRIIFILN